MTEAFELLLVRHGEPRGYAGDAGLTALGREHSYRKGLEIASSLLDDMTVQIPHAPTARARETAESLREGLLKGLAQQDRTVTVHEPQVNPWFDNFRVWCNGTLQDPAQAFPHYALIKEQREGRGQAELPGWYVEMDRFFGIQNTGGDPIAYWLSQPLLYFESPAATALRLWQGIIEMAQHAPDGLLVCVCTHSGCMRALAAAAVGRDPGEPDHLEEIRIRVLAEHQRANVAYREHHVEVPSPVDAILPWTPAMGTESTTSSEHVEGTNCCRSWR